MTPMLLVATTARPRVSEELQQLRQVARLTQADWGRKRSRLKVVASSLLFPIATARVCPASVCPRQILHTQIAYHFIQIQGYVEILLLSFFSGLLQIQGYVA